VQANQDLAHGPEISPIDPTYSGREVTIEKTKGGIKSNISKEELKKQL
jgi:hypothetical protein